VYAAQVLADFSRSSRNAMCTTSSVPGPELSPALEGHTEAFPSPQHSSSQCSTKTEAGAWSDEEQCSGLLDSLKSMETGLKQQVKGARSRRR
jgi:hypothetical protein